MSSVLVFDRVCVLCSRWVHFVLRHDRGGRYRFASMQGEHGRRLLIEHGIDPIDPVSFLLFEDDVGYTGTTAIIRVLRSFGGVWAVLASLLRITPRALRDALYRWIARNRYRWFGQRPTCLTPRADIAHRFLN